MTNYTLGRLKDREAASALRNLEFRAAEIDAISDLIPEAQKMVKVLKGRKTNAPRDAYAYLASLPSEMLAFIEVELPNPRALSKIRNYMQKWRPLRLALPVAELDALGVPRGPKFDKILDQMFDMQLRGKAKTPEDRTRILRDLAGIKDEVKKKPEKEKKKGKGGKLPLRTAEDGLARKAGRKDLRCRIGVRHITPLPRSGPALGPSTRKPRPRGVPRIPNRNLITRRNLALARFLLLIASFARWF